MNITQKALNVKDSYLKTQIENYWFFEASSTAKSPGKISVPPLAMPCMHFHLSLVNDFYVRDNYNHKSLIIGQLKTHTQLNPPNGLKLFVINFKPYGLYNLFGITPPGKTGLSVNSKDFFGDKNIEDIIEALSNTTKESELVDIAESFILKNQKHDIKKYNYLDSITDMISQSNGLTDINELINNKCSVRTLQRYFSEVIGTSPKTYTKILRHKHILKLIYENPELQWNDLVFQGYYFDYSHFRKDFAGFSSLKPFEFISAKTSIISGLLR